MSNQADLAILSRIILLTGPNPRRRTFTARRADLVEIVEIEKTLAGGDPQLDQMTKMVLVDLAMAKTPRDLVDLGRRAAVTLAQFTLLAQAAR